MALFLKVDLEIQIQIMNLKKIVHSEPSPVRNYAYHR